MEVVTTPVEQLMSTELTSTTPDTTAEDAAETLLEEDVGSLIVFDQEGNLAGIVTSTDLIEIVSAGRAPTGSTISDYMTTDVVTIDAADSIHDAAVKMIRKDIQHLPVTGDGDDVVGMVSATDITTQLTYMGSSGAD